MESGGKDAAGQFVIKTGTSTDGKVDRRWKVTETYRVNHKWGRFCEKIVRCKSRLLSYEYFSPNFFLPGCAQCQESDFFSAQKILSLL